MAHLALTGPLYPESLLGLRVAVVQEPKAYRWDRLVTVRFVDPEAACAATDGMYGLRPVRVPPFCLKKVVA